MSTFELPGRRTSWSPAAASWRSALPVPLAPATVTAALLVVVLYAAFSQGATQSPAEPRIQVVLAAIGALAAGSWLWTGRMRLAAPASAWAGLGLLAAFAAWSGVSVIWSVAPTDTWVELNRYVCYVLVLCLAIGLGASSVRSVERVAVGYLVVALAVTAYALAQKLFPGIHVPGLFNLDQTYQFSRLEQPFGYWNALALFLVMAVPIALALLVDRERDGRTRIAAAIALELMVLVIFFTYSRGGLLALVVALAVSLALGGRRLRSLLWVGVIGLTTLVPLVYGLVSHALSSSLVPLDSREVAGLLLTLAVAASLGALVLLARRVIALEDATVISPQRVRAITRGLLALVGLAVVVALLAAAVSSRGLTGTVTHAWHSFTATRSAGNSNPIRLLSADSANRWVWWKEALGAFSSRPVGGWGAGSFPVVHLLYRKNTLSVREPHSVPLQWLAETGVIGALLGIAAIVVLLSAGVRTVRRLPPGRGRVLAGTLIASACAYAVHACYDFDADIPGLTIPMLLMLGTVLGAASLDRRPVRSHRGTSRMRLSGRLAGEPRLGSRPGTGGARALGVAAIAFAMCSFALSAALPSLASQKASAALVDAARGGTGNLRHAQSLALVSERLNPLSDAGLVVESQIAQRQGRLLLARDYLLEAVRRDPTDVNAWLSLAEVELDTGNYASALAAAQRLVALDPLGVSDGIFEDAAGRATTAQVALAPPQDSATRIATPAPATTSPAAGATTPSAGATTPSAGATPPSAGATTPATAGGAAVSTG